MSVYFRRVITALAALLLSSSFAAAQTKVTLAIGGASCLCYLPTMLAHQLGEYKKAGVSVAIAHIAGHVVYGIIVGLMVFALPISYGFRMNIQ